MDSKMAIVSILMIIFGGPFLALVGALLLIVAMKAGQEEEG